MKIHKSDAARRQIEAASVLLISDGDPLAVITLAGAAEEILGNLLRRNNKPAMLDQLIELDRQLTGGRDFNVLNNEINNLRNALKHAKVSAEDEFEVDAKAELAMLGRALVNYVLWGGELTEPMIKAYEFIKTKL